MEKKGFTLIEILAAVIIVGILAGALLLTLNPVERFARARDATRATHLEALSIALETFVIRSIRDSEQIEFPESPKEICLMDVECEGEDLIDLSYLVIGGYIDSLPVDPQGGVNPLGTGYQVYLQDGKIGVIAMKMETISFEEDACNDQANLEYNDYTYNLTAIGDQCWFAQNLRSLYYKDGTTLIPGFLNGGDWEGNTTGAFSIYPHGEAQGINSDLEMADAYGFLYNWFAVDNPNGLCPEDWRVPSNDDWDELVDFIQENGNSLKSCYQVDSPLGGDCDITDHPRWTAHESQYGTDDLNFSALPSGLRFSTGESYFWIGDFSIFWSSDEVDAMDARNYRLAYNASTLGAFTFDKGFGLSVRCLMDN